MSVPHYVLPMARAMVKLGPTATNADLVRVFQDLHGAARNFDWKTCNAYVAKVRKLIGKHRRDITQDDLDTFLAQLEDDIGEEDDSEADRRAGVLSP